MALVRALTVLSLLLGAACGTSGQPGGSRPKVVASFYPLAFVVEEIGGDLVELVTLTPPGAEPHDLELTSGQVRDLADADLVLYMGEGFQPSLEDALREIDVSRIDVLTGQDDLIEAHEPSDDGETPVDPHVWLDPERVALIVEMVTERLVRLAPDDADRLRARASKLRSRLDELDAEFRSALARCERSTLVTSHEAFGYLAGAYGLEEVGIAGIDPEAEPSPRRLAEVARFVEENDVTTIFFEVLVPPQTAETLAEEVGVETARLDPLESPPESGDYFSAMRENLGALRRGLDCG